MNPRLLIVLALFASGAAGVGAGALLSQNAMRSIRGIKGIDTVMLQNLEAVLRMQAPPPPPEGGGAVQAAAALLTTESDAQPGPETETDDRKELTELELEGS